MANTMVGLLMPDAPKPGQTPGQITGQASRRRSAINFRKHRSFKTFEELQESYRKQQVASMLWCSRKLKPLVQERKAQGTTEYAILVGVLVVIAIVAIVAFKGKIQELWNAISDGINSL